MTLMPKLPIVGLLKLGVMASHESECFQVCSRPLHLDKKRKMDRNALLCSFGLAGKSTVDCKEVEKYEDLNLV